MEETSREHYLKKFEVKNKEVESFGQAKEVGEELVAFIQTKELTYIEAYASLEYAFNKLECESKLVPVKFVSKK